MSAALKIEEAAMSLEELKAKNELTLDEAAFYMGLARRTFYNSWRARGLTGHRDHRGRMLFKRADLDHYMKSSRKAVRGY